MYSQSKVQDQSLFFANPVVVVNKCIFPFQRFPTVPKVLATVRHAGSSRPQDAMNMWIEEQQEDHFRICVREVKTFDGKHQNIQVVSVLLHRCLSIQSF